MVADWISAHIGSSSGNRKKILSLYILNKNVNLSYIPKKKMHLIVHLYEFWCLFYLHRKKIYSTYKQHSHSIPIYLKLFSALSLLKSFFVQYFMWEEIHILFYTVHKLWISNNRVIFKSISLQNRLKVKMSCKSYT